MPRHTKFSLSHRVDLPAGDNQFLDWLSEEGFVIGTTISLNVAKRVSRLGWEREDGVAARIDYGFWPDDRKPGMPWTELHTNDHAVLKSFAERKWIVMKA